MEWQIMNNARVYWHDPSGTFMILAIDQQQPLDWAIVLEMGGKGGWDVKHEGTLPECFEYVRLALEAYAKRQQLERLAPKKKVPNVLQLPFSIKRIIQHWLGIVDNEIERLRENHDDDMAAELEGLKKDAARYEE